MLDYDREAGRYDQSRGGEARAAEAAGAVERLLPSRVRTVIDVGGGTGIVTARLTKPGRTVLVVDASFGMLEVAASRLGGRAVRGDAARLPLRTGCADAVVLIWLLHLLSDAAPVVAEAARLLRPGGVLVTTVDKDDAYFATPSDLAEATAQARRDRKVRPADERAHIVGLAARHGLAIAGETIFVGCGQGRTPVQALKWVPGAAEAVAALPDQGRPRPDPIYTLVAFSLPGSTA